MRSEKINEAIREFKSMMSRPIFESADGMTHQALRGIDIDRKFAPITTPDDNDKNDLQRFRNEVDALFNGSAYDEFVPNEYEEVEGARRDLDDWDIYRINLQSTIDEESFWDQIFDRLYDEYSANQKVKASELAFWFEKAGYAVAQEALENYQPNEDKDELIHRGVYKSEAYWHA